MSQTLQVEDAVRKAEQHWYEDGLSSIFTGIVLLGIVALGYFVPTHLNRPTALWLLCGGYGVFLVLAILQSRFVEWIKKRVTYPRIGYTPPPPSAVGVRTEDTGFWPAPPPSPMEQAYLDRQGQLWRKALAAIYMATGCIALLWGGYWFLVFAIICAVFFLTATPDVRAAYFTPVAYFLLGAGRRFLAPQVNDGLLTLVFCVGVLVSLAGVYKLIRFLRRNPVTAQTGP